MGNTCQNRWDGVGTRRTDPEEAIAKIQAAAEEMTMHRYVHSLPVQTAREWEREALWCQMRELNQVLEDHGAVCGGESGPAGGRLDLDLEDEKVNPKFAQIAVKAYLQRAGFAPDTRVEIGGMEIGIYE